MAHPLWNFISNDIFNGTSCIKTILKVVQASENTLFIFFKINCLRDLPGILA